MPNKSEKMQNFKNTLIVFGLIILFIGCFLLAVITPFAITLHDKVAHADSTNGVVEDNIITSNFDVDNVVSSSSYTIKDWINWNGLFSSAFYNPLGYTTLYRGSSSNNSNTSFVFPITAGLTYTFSVNINNTIFSTSYTFSSIPTSSGAFGQTSIVLDGVVQGYIRFDYRNFCPVGSVSCTICLFASSTIQSFDVYFAKVEVGSSFTGYVPKDYTNYGYTQGYNDGTKDTLDTFNTIRGYKIWGATTYWFNDDLLAGYHYLDKPMSGLSAVIVRRQPSFFEYNGVAYELFNDAYNQPSGTALDFYSNYEYGFTPLSATGYPTIPISLNIGYVSGPLYLCSDYSFYENNVQIVVRRHDGTSTVFIDQFTVSAYYNDIPVMDLSPYLQGGFFYDFYMCSKTKGTGVGSPSSFRLRTHNTYFTGINSICLITVDNSDVLGASSYEEGRKAGYDAGKQAGYWEGYGYGYSQGELVAPAEGQYTFLGVIGALFDAPIGALSSFLNFDLLGFNMRSFFFALISLAFIILVLRIVLGSKL